MEMAATAAGVALRRHAAALRCIMAGYLANLVVPVGLGPLVRAWLIARVTGLEATEVLATVAVDRVIDGVVFVGFAALWPEVVTLADLRVRGTGDGEDT